MSSRGMRIVPAVDLLGGRCVRLDRGRYDRARVFDEDPAAVAGRLAAAGAPDLHVVDLDGARDGSPRHLDVLARIAAAAPGAAIAFGGGIRSRAEAENALAAGAVRVIVGSRAVRDPAWLPCLVSALGPEAVAGALDLHDSAVAVEGWTATVSDRAPEAVWEAWKAAGLRYAVVTDTTRDGTLAGVEPQLYQQFTEGAIEVTAAGGIAGPADLDRLAEAGVAAAVVGLALYTGAIELEDLARRGWRWASEAG